MDKSAYIKVLKSHKTTCVYLKQINSNKANKYMKYNNRLTYITLIFAVILSAIAFIDKNFIIDLFSLNKYIVNNSNQIKIIDLCFNGLALLVLILTLINLLCRFQEKSSIYFHTVITLSSMIGDINLLLNIEIEDDEVKFLEKFNLVVAKYNGMSDYLPQHTDNDFLKAKYDTKIKRELSNLIKENRVPKWKMNIYCFKLKICLEIDNKKKSDV
ncbi:hypothetical protein EZS27_014672 [termite gut metagenome]|uniref:SMODS and SLOG-associating 2TM effector domain-containing protein n=1 Tax=termite gut metagenome TaxID=433724 RepID=A0A5J4RUX5_9ZZZZ